MTEALKVGTKMDDGTIYAGISPDTHKPMYAAPADESLTLTFNEAGKRAEELSKTTGKAYRVPSASELNVLFNNRAAIGGFNETESDSSDSRYWSSSPYNCSEEGYMRVQRFSDGGQVASFDTIDRNLRLVRD